MKTLYLGIDPPSDKTYVHYPIIETIFRPVNAEAVLALQDASHLIFTSKNGIRSVSDFLECCRDKPAFAVGKQTANLLFDIGFTDVKIAELETAEGVVQLLDKQSFDNPFFVWPHSSLSRLVIEDYFKQKQFRYYAFVAYDTQSCVSQPYPNFDQFDEIVFTSPSTVTTFLEHFGQPPARIKLTPIGPVTQQSILINFNK